MSLQSLAARVLDLAAGASIGQNRVLRVNDNQFAAEHIVEGDNLVLSVREPEPGDVVLATVNDEKRMGTLSRDERGGYWITSSEFLIPPVCFVPGVDEIEGVLVAVVRPLSRAA